MPNSVYYLPLRMVTDSLGAVCEDAQFSYRYALADEAFDAAIGRVPKGAVVGIDGRLSGRVGAREVIEYRFIWKMVDQGDWPTGDGRYLLRIDGDPLIESEVNISTKTDSGRAVSLSTAMAVVNAVPAVCRATPGVKSYYELPLHFGGYVSTGQ
jgi:4-hydroxy-tetrahydrodipicolinate reductase